MRDVSESGPLTPAEDKVAWANWELLPATRSSVRTTARLRFSRMAAMGAVSRPGAVPSAPTCRQEGKAR